MTSLLALMLVQSLFTASPPSTEDWTTFSEEIIEVRLGGYGTTAYLGLIITYQNPNNENEFIKVVKRHTPIISVKHSIKDKESRYVVRKYSESNESSALDELRKEADAVIYVQWKQKKDSWTDEYIQDGATKSWIYSQTGLWHGAFENKVVKRSISEPVGEKGETEIVGFQFRLGEFYQILRIDTADILGEENE